MTSILLSNAYKNGYLPCPLRILSQIQSGEIFPVFIAALVAVLNGGCTIGDLSFAKILSDVKLTMHNIVHQELDYTNGLWRQGLNV
jgi:hypothetical protein